MNSFSAPQDYSTTSNDTITITPTPFNWSGSGHPGFIAQDVSSVTPNVTTTSSVTGGGYGGSGVSTVTITGGGSGYTIGGVTGTINIGSITSGAGGDSDWSYSITEFVNSFPDFNRVQDMCETYPGLKIAYEKFVTTYKLVKDDYDNPNKKES